MFSFITKESYWSALDDVDVSRRLDATTRAVVDLKHVQDAWMLDRLSSFDGKRILEVGGGFARILRTLSGNDRWNLDKVNGAGRIVINKRLVMPEGIRLVKADLGEFCRDLPDDYFDVVFSISVLEHVPSTAIDDFWKDHARILKPGAVAYHAVDFYLGDEPNEANERRLNSYVSAIEKSGLEFLVDEGMERPAVFRCSYATNPDLGMKHWNEISPSLIKQRAVKQSVSLAIAIRKPLLA